MLIPTKTRLAQSAAPILLAIAVFSSAFAGACQRDTALGGTTYEEGYAPGDAAECEPLRDALHEPSEAIVRASAGIPGEGRTVLEAALSARLRSFVERQCYKLEGWAGEDGVHLTGSPDEGDTHGWVRVWYSPEVTDWIRRGRPKDQVPARAVIVKERFRPIGDESAPKFRIIGWQPMVRRAGDAHDGWFWGDISQEEARHGELECDPAALAATDDKQSTVPDCRPPSGFGQPCLRCHASAPSDLTFSQGTHLIERTGGILARSQTIYGYRELWRPEDRDNEKLGYVSYLEAKPSAFIAGHPDRAAFPRALGTADPALVSLYFGAGAPDLEAQAALFPSRLLDNVVAPAGDATAASSFLTSSQCWGCHSGVPHVGGDTVDYATGTLKRHTPGFSMIAEAGTLSDGRKRWADVSPYGEWSVSMMGLAGKDPVFFAQHEWETNSRAACAAEITSTCYGCHGVAGRRQLDVDEPQKRFTHDMVFASARDADAKYGALARDGVTCTVCHRMAGEGLGTPKSYTGGWMPAAPGRLHGPYEKDVRDAPMKSALGITPIGDADAVATLTSSALCGSCHAVKLPVYRAGTCETIGTVYEQSTFQEWRNSDYRKNDAFIADTGQSGPEPATCQTCHMPRSFRGEELARKVASIEDSDFPTSNLEGLIGVHQDEHLGTRPTYSRHALNGLNLFALGMFQQFPQRLGIADYDFMTNQYGEPLALQMATAIESGKTLAAATASVRVASVLTEGADLVASVEVVNKAGHRLPTGVSFRRVILQFEVQDASGSTLWMSGRIDGRGLIMGRDGKTPLETELSTTKLEPHHQEIRSADEVQIYEERIFDSNKLLTTSFLGIAESAKDNRIVAKGYRPGFEPTMEDGKVPAGLEPDGVAGDLDYVPASIGGTPGSTSGGACGCDTIRYRIPKSDLPGAARVVARLYYQAIPPYYLRDRFTLASTHPESLRLAQLVTHLRTDSDAGGIQGWKLPLAEASAPVP